MGCNRERHSSHSDVAAAPALVSNCRERCSRDAFNSCAADTRGKPLASSILHFENINMHDEAESFSSLQLTGEDHKFNKSADGEAEDHCGFEPPRFASEAAPSSSSSAFFPNTVSLQKESVEISPQKPEFLFSSKFQALNSGICHQRRARKVGKRRSLSTDMVNYSVESQDWLLCTKRRSTHTSSECFKRRYIKCKPSQLAKELVSRSDVTTVQRTCPNVDLDSSTLSGLPESDTFGVLDLVGDNQVQHVHKPSDMRRRGCGMDRDGIKAKEKSDSFGVLDLVGDKQEQHVHGPSDACRRKFVMDCDGPKDEEMDEECGLSRQRTSFLAWFAGLIIRALRFQLKFMFSVFISLVLAWYHSIRFALNPISYMLQVKHKATAAHGKEYTNMATLGQRRKDRTSAIRPTFATGARRLAFGCTTALYTTIILTSLFVASLALSFFVVKGFVYEPIQMYEYLYFDYTKPHPAASVDFASSKMYSDTGSIIKRIACPTTHFRATVFLTVPESEFNKELGLFQVTAELLSVTGKVLLSRTQPCMLRFKSSALQHAKSLLMAIPLLTGFYSETQSLAVSSVEWKEQRAISFAAVRVVLAPRAGRPLHTGLPELYEAGLSVKSEIPWWVSIVGHWRWTISVWIGLALFVGVVVLVLCVCKQILLPDLGRVLSIVTVRRGFHSCLKHEKFITEPALDARPLDSERVEFGVSEDNCTLTAYK